MFREDPEPSLRQRREAETRDRAEAQSLALSDLAVPSRAHHVLQADPAVPFLEMAWSLSQMQEFFNRHVLPTVWPGREVTAVAIKDLTYKPRATCEIQYALQCGDLTPDQSTWAVV